jgi:lipid A 3-O-deacylase
MKTMRLFERVGFFLAVFFLIAVVSAHAGETQPQTGTNLPPSSISGAKTAESHIWREGVGQGFRAGAQTLGFNTGAMYGIVMLGGHMRHDLVLGALSYGRMIGGLRGVDQWYRGNWELRGEIFGGWQFDPLNAWVIGLTPHIRYHFATGSRWVPYIDAGAGVCWTDIGLPDLGNSFQFNPQAGLGLNWFVRDNLAVSFECRYLHISSAGLSMPNDGVNTIGGLVGLNWFF